jgi:ATP-dependent Clp protease adapter protein ClpS
VGRLTDGRTMANIGEDPRHGVLPGIYATGPGVLENPELAHEATTEHGKGWIVTVYNNDYNTYEQVITILMIATGCSEEEAYIEAWEVDHLGKSVVHYADEQECNDVAAIISKIGIRVEVSAE